MKKLTHSVEDDSCVIHRSETHVHVKNPIEPQYSARYQSGPESGIRSPSNQHYKPFGKMIDWGLVMTEIKNSFDLDINTPDFMADLKNDNPEFFDNFYANSTKMSGCSSRIYDVLEKYRLIMEAKQQEHASKMSIRSKDILISLIRNEITKLKIAEEQTELMKMKSNVDIHALRNTGYSHKNDLTNRKLKTSIRDSYSRFKRIKAGATLTNFFSPNHKEETSHKENSAAEPLSLNKSPISRKGNSVQNLTSQRNKNCDDTLVSSRKDRKDSSDIAKSPPFHQSFGQSSVKSQSPEPFLQPISTRVDPAKRYYLPARVTKTVWPKTPRTNPTFLTNAETSASDEYQIQSQVMQTSTSAIKLRTPDMTLNISSYNKPFISLPNLFREYEIFEAERNQRPTINPFTNKPEKTDLVFSLKTKIKHIEDQRKTINKLDEHRRLSQQSSSSKIREGAGSGGKKLPQRWFHNKNEKHEKPEIPHQKHLTKDPSTKDPIKHVAAVVSQAEEMSKRISKGIQSFKEMKQDYNDELNSNLNRLDFARNARYMIKNKNFGSFIARDSKANLDFIRRVSTTHEEDFFKSQVPKDIEWYKELVWELATQNYKLNDGVFILFNNIRNHLERGNSLDKLKFVEFVEKIKRDHFSNLAFLYILRKISRNIGMKKKELILLLRDMKLFDLIPHLENNTFKVKVDSLVW